MIKTRRTKEITPELLAFTPLSEADIEWLLPKLDTCRDGDGLRAFALDSYDARCRETGSGSEYAALAKRVGRYPSLTFIPINMAMLLSFSAARWVHTDQALSEALHDLHEEAVFRQMSSGIVGKPLVLSSNGQFGRFIENMTMFPKFAVNFGEISCSLADTKSRTMIVHHEDFYSWMDIFMSATYRALGRFFGHDVSVRVEINSPWSMDHHLSW